jgi:hypothetical protein
MAGSSMTEEEKMTTVEICREKIGLPMVSRAHGQWISWTTDREKAMAAREAGCVIEEVGPPNYSFTGWDVSCLVDPVVLTVVE